ncbi:MAG: sulfate ABC transporter substrate-binding protein [Gemmataceae bacterium]|nr:sulfate ABC transporter substrate-binding protein [Gemmataceae bacterium]MCI0742822.1 sulfate ABC transporter substrate-binding protein [Gemmataceae bacterium]
MTKKCIRLLCAALLASFFSSTTGCGNVGESKGMPSLELLNVSYDPTRELWRDINGHFIPTYEKDQGVRLSIKQSHGGSSTQARAVIDGLEADVVTLAAFPDTNAISRKGLIAEDWLKRLPHNSLPYYSTIVFVVRKGNPKGVKDWNDLVQSDVSIITPNPKTSGNGYLTFLSAWGSVVLRGGSREDAVQFVTKLYKQVPVLDSGARGATATFVHRKIGDVHLAWENEAHLEVREAKGALELIYPPISIRAEPHVAVVDANVDRKKTRAAAEAYLKFLYTDPAQEIIAKHFYRPSNEAILKKHSATFPDVKLFSITEIASSWAEAHKQFIGQGGVFDDIYRPKSK